MAVENNTQSAYGVPIGSIIAKSIVVAEQSYAAEADGRKLMAGPVRVEAGTVTGFVRVAGGNGANSIALYANGRRIGTTAIPSAGEFTVSGFAPRGSIIRFYMLNAPGSLITLGGAASVAARSSLTFPTRGLGTRSVALGAATYTADSTGTIAMSQGLAAGYGMVVLTTIVTGGTGTNVQKLYRNGAAAASTTIASTGTWTTKLNAVEEGDTVQAFNTNGAGFGMTISGGSLVFYPQRR